MRFWLGWFRQVRFYLMWKFVQAISVRPFLQVDENEYCPACGHRQGHIQAVTDGQQVQVRHVCEVCSYAWDVATVVEIDPKTIIPLELKSEEGEEQPQKPVRFVKMTRQGEDGPRVNNKELPEKTGIGDRKKPATAIL